MIELWRALAMLCDGTLLLGLKKKSVCCSSLEGTVARFQSTIDGFSDECLDAPASLWIIGTSRADCRHVCALFLINKRARGRAHPGSFYFSCSEEEHVRGRAGIPDNE
jgi:hypothetical protein